MSAYTVDRRPLAVPAFRRLWLASAVAAVGGSFSVVAVPIQLYAVTGSSGAVGVAGAVSCGALAVAALWAGALADVRDRRPVLLVAHAGLAAAYAALWAQAAVGNRSLALLLTLVAAQGVTLGAITAVNGAVLPRLVPAGLLPAANSLSALVRYGGAVCGPLLAGALMPAVGLATLYLCDAVALLAVLWAVFRLPPLPPGRAPVAGSLARQLVTGFRYLLARRLLVAVLAVDLAAMVFGMPAALFPELAATVYAGPAGGGTAVGLLYAAYPVGVIAAGLLSGTFTRARRHGAIMAGAAAAWGGTVLLLALADGLALALSALVLGGAVNFLLSTFRNAISQAHTDDALRGRVQGTLTVVLIGGPQVGHLLHGAAAVIWPARAVVAAGGLLTVAAVAAIAWSTPSLRHYTAPAPP